MPRLFGSKRKSHLNEGKTLKYLKYAAGEILLIVVGILLALQVNAWNQERTNRKLERNYLIRIQNDLAEDLNEFSEQQRLGRIGLDALKEAIQLIHQENTEEDIYKFNELYDKAWVDILSPQTSTYVELESTGGLSLIRDEELRLAILKHYAFYKRMQTDFDRLYVWHKTITLPMDRDTDILKYDNANESIFPPQLRSKDDWSFINDPEHAHFRVTETAVAATAYWVDNAIDDFDVIIEAIGVLQDQIAEALEALE